MFFAIFESQIKTVNTVIFALAVLSIPVLGLGIIFGLAGSTSEYYYLIAISYIGVLVSGIKTYFNPKFFVGTIIFSILIFTGFYLDSIYWEKHNDELCKKIKAEPSCTESEYGFSCKNIDGISAHFSKSICK